MPDDNQSTTNQSASTGATDAANTDIDMTGIDPDLKIPSLDDLEYATPSAYIDPDLPTAPTEVETPEEEKEEAPEEETIEMTPEQIADYIKNSNKTMANVAEKVSASRNILITVSSDPSVDELASALSLTLFLDRLGKHAIAVYSGAIPNSLGFLNPTENFEENADVFQDFVVSIDKDKADHLRYKLDGDFVRVFITPYKSRIISDDLEFSYGDYNVDLVLALNVSNGIDLDPSLREYGTIMKDATVVNITTGNPGKFGEIEWSNKFASSTSEMVANLFLSSNGDTQLNDKEATTLLTGIVAATDRFAKANTFPGTMQVASRLLDAGADQQLVAANISDDLDNQFFTFSDAKERAEAAARESDEVPTFAFNKSDEPKEDKLANDSSALRISHGEEDLDEPAEPVTAPEPSPEPASESAPESVPEPTPDLSPEPSSESAPESSDSSSDSGLLDELKATEASLMNVGAETVSPSEAAPVVEPVLASEPAVAPIASPEITSTPVATQETVISPAGASDADATSKYSQMLQDAIATPAAAEPAPMESALPPVANPATTSAPTLEPAPEVSNMPEINYGQTTDDQLLPPPPTPPMDTSSTLPLPAPTDLPPAPSTPSAPAATAPDTFTIPGV